MLNLIIRKPVAVPPYDIRDEKSFTCDAVLVRLDPYDQEYITIEEDGKYVIIKHNDREVSRYLIEEP